MKPFSTNQVAKKLGIATKTLSRYIAQGKVPAPHISEVGGSIIHSWTEAEIEQLSGTPAQNCQRQENTIQKAVSTQQSGISQNKSTGKCAGATQET